MVFLPQFTGGLALLTVISRVASHFAYGTDITLEVSITGIFDIIQTFIGYAPPEGSPVWLAFIFGVMAFLWVLVLGAFLFSLAGNTVTGTILAAIGVVVGLFALF